MAMSDTIAAVIRLACGASLKALPFEADTRRRIFFANHGSNLDFPIIWAVLPRPIRNVTRPVAALDYWTATPVRRYFSVGVFNAVLVDRSGSVPPQEKTRGISEAVGSGSSIIIFPEGTRSLDGRIGTFKSGIFHLADEHPEVELVPVYLENLGRILPKGESLPVPLLTSVFFGMPFKKEPGEAKQDFLDRARGKLLDLVPT